MYKERAALLEAMAKVPGLAELEIPVEEMPSDEEFHSLTDDFMAALDLDVELELGLGQFPFEADPALALTETGEARGSSTTSVSTAPVACPTRSEVRPGKVTPISIRIPPRVVSAYRAKAKEKGIGYQTLMVRVLKGAAESW